MRFTAQRSITTTAILLALSSCALVPSNPCLAPLTSAVSERLYFGTATPHGVVSDAEWQAFVSQVIGPAFPQGFTTWDADGRWRGKSGDVIVERTHVVEFIHAPNESAGNRIHGIIEEYRRRFAQESVMHTREAACVSF